MKLDPDTIKQLTGKTLVSESTIRRWAKGSKCNSSNVRVLEAALREIQQSAAQPEGES